MSIKQNSFKIFSFSCFFFITSCASQVAEIEGKSNFSSIESRANTIEYHTVKYGDSLWNISFRYYGNPYYWPDIYKHNSDNIYDADLILPGQSIIIHKNISTQAKGKAQAYAKIRGLWVVGYREESDVKFLESN